MGESNNNLASAIPSLGNFGPRSDRACPSNLPRETCHRFSSETQDDLIMNIMMGKQDANAIQDAGISTKSVAAPTAAKDDTAAPNSFGKKRPALEQLPSPDPIRQHLETAEDESFYNMNSPGAHRARLVALLTYIHKYSGDMEKRLDARISNLESTRQIVQNNEISVITINPLAGNAKKKSILTDYTHKANSKSNDNNNNSSGSDDDTADALESLREMQVNQMEIKYATMETHYRTQLAFAHSQYQESQRSVACFQSVAAAAMEQAKICRDELAAVKAQMRTAHVALLKEVATIVHNLKDEVDSLKDDHQVLAARAFVVSRQVPPEVSSNIEERQNWGG